MKFLIEIGLAMTLIDLSGLGFEDDIAKQVLARAVVVCDRVYHGKVSTVTRKSELVFDVKCRRDE